MEAQARTHQLLIHNRELLDHIAALVVHLQEGEKSSGHSQLLPHVAMPQVSSILLCVCVIFLRCLLATFFSLASLVSLMYSTHTKMSVRPLILRMIADVLCAIQLFVALRINMKQITSRCF